jgi:hypothetical protein
VDAEGNTKPGFICMHELENGSGPCGSNVFAPEDGIDDHSCFCETFWPYLAEDHRYLPHDDLLRFNSLRGHLTIPYAELLAVLGQPHHVLEGDKVRVRWAFDTPFGPVTIYDWKSNLPVERVVDWSFGGRDYDAVQTFGAYYGWKVYDSDSSLSW